MFYTEHLPPEIRTLDNRKAYLRIKKVIKSPIGQAKYELWKVRYIMQTPNRELNYEEYITTIGKKLETASAKMLELLKTSIRQK